MKYLSCINTLVDLTHPQVMGILNITPDSFYEGSRCQSIDHALQKALQMQQEGAAIIDVGGESTRPGSQAITVQEELDRVIPIIEKLHQEISIPISIDTFKPAVMHAAIAAGATMVNDIQALNMEGALKIIKETGVAVCLMHMQGKPQTMQENPHYENVIKEVYDFLAERVNVCLQAGIKQEQIIIDPGFGFGKKAEHNLLLLKHLDEFQKLNFPMLVGLSRKTMIGKILNKPVDDRLYGSLTAAVIAALKGAKVIRTHDVMPTIQALQIVDECLNIKI